VTRSNLKQYNTIHEYVTMMQHAIMMTVRDIGRQSYSFVNLLNMLAS